MFHLRIFILSVQYTKCSDSLTDFNNLKPNYTIGKIGPWCFCYIVHKLKLEERDKKRFTNRSPPQTAVSLSIRLNVCNAYHTTLKHENETENKAYSLSVAPFNPKHDEYIYKMYLHFNFTNYQDKSNGFFTRWLYHCRL